MLELIKTQDASKLTKAQQEENVKNLVKAEDELLATQKEQQRELEESLAAEHEAAMKQLDADETHDSDPLTRLSEAHDEELTAVSRELEASAALETAKLEAALADAREARTGASIEEIAAEEAAARAELAARLDAGRAQTLNGVRARHARDDAAATGATDPDKELARHLKASFERQERALKDALDAERALKREQLERRLRERRDKKLQQPAARPNLSRSCKHND